MKLENKKNTKELMENAQDMELSDYVKLAPSTPEKEAYKLLNGYVSKSGMSTSDIAKNAGIDSNYCGKILSGKRRNPGRDYLIRIGIALKLEIEELNYLLKRFGLAELSPNNSKRDAIIVYGIIHGKSKDEIDDDLEAQEEKTF